MRRLVLAISLRLALRLRGVVEGSVSAAPSAPAAPSPRRRRARREARLAVVADASVRLTDPSRSGTCRRPSTYPGGAGPFPVIVFSHGAGGSGGRYDAARAVLGDARASWCSLPVTPTTRRRRQGPGERERPRVRRAPGRPARATSRSSSAATAAVEARVPALTGKLDGATLGVGRPLLRRIHGGASGRGDGGRAEGKSAAKARASPIRSESVSPLSPPGEGAAGTDRELMGRGRAAR